MLPNTVHALLPGHHSKFPTSRRISVPLPVSRYGLQTMTLLLCQPVIHGVLSTRYMLILSICSDEVKAIPTVDYKILRSYEAIPQPVGPVAPRPLARGAMLFVRGSMAGLFLCRAPRPARLSHLFTIPMLWPAPHGQRLPAGFQRLIHSGIVTYLPRSPADRVGWRRGARRPVG